MLTKLKRDNTLDIAKGISILLMTITHLDLFKSFPSLMYLNSNILMLFKMPLFIFISGVLFSNRLSFIEFTINKFDGLLKPIITILASSCLILFLFYTSTQSFSFELLRRVHEHIFYLYFPLWFPFTLFISLVIFKLLFVLKDKVKLSILVMTVFFTILLTYSFTLFNLGYSLFLFFPIFYFLIILSIGYIFKKYNLLILMYRLDFFIFSIIILLLSTFFKEFLLIKLDLALNEFGKLIPTTLAFLSGISVILYVAKTIGKSATLSNLFIVCSKGSFYILAFHILLGNIIFYPYFNKLISNTFIASSFTFVVTIAICLLLYKLTYFTKYLKYALMPIKTIK